MRFLCSVLLFSVVLIAAIEGYGRHFLVVKNVLKCDGCTARRGIWLEKNHYLDIALIQKSMNTHSVPRSNDEDPKKPANTKNATIITVPNQHEQNEIIQLLAQYSDSLRSTVQQLCKTKLAMQKCCMVNKPRHDAYRDTNPEWLKHVLVSKYKGYCSLLYTDQEHTVPENNSKQGQEITSSQTGGRKQAIRQ